MRMRLATKPNEKACSGDACVANQAFDAQVQALGVRLAQSAYAVYPDLKKKIPNFVFGVADKKVVGSASNAKGTVIMFRGLQHLDLGEEATAFIVAREMGHVIANHHKSNAKTKIFFTVLAGVLFPAVNILSASGAAAQATTATTLLTSAASTATSYVGSEVALSRIKPTQLTEADDIALKLLEHQGWNKADIAQSLEYIAENENGAAWEKDLYQSIAYVRKVAGEPKESVAELEPLPEAYIAPEANIGVPLEQVVSTKRPEEHLAKLEKAALPLQPEQKPVEQHKIILITNQTIAESHHQAEKLPVPSRAKASEAKKPVVKKSMSKKMSVEKLKGKSVVNTKKIAAKKSKEKPVASKRILKTKVKNSLKTPVKSSKPNKSKISAKPKPQKIKQK